MNKLLIVDDSEFDRRMLASALRRNCIDIEIIELADGRDVVKTMRLKSPKLTVLDIRMPSMSGWDVLDDIKADGRLSNHNVVMMSGSYSNQDTELAVTKGADAFYTKPHSLIDYGKIANNMKTAFIDRI